MRITKNYNDTNETIIGHDIITELTPFGRFDFQTNFCTESIETADDNYDDESLTDQYLYLQDTIIALFGIVELVGYIDARYV